LPNLLHLELQLTILLPQAVDCILQARLPTRQLHKILSQMLQMVQLTPEVPPILDLQRLQFVLDNRHDLSRSFVGRRGQQSAINIPDNIARVLGRDRANQVRWWK